MNDHGFTVAVYNRTVSKVDDFLKNEAKGSKVIGTHSIQDLVAVLKKPRRVFLLVKAGQAVDDFIEQLLPHLEKGDIIIDGGNSHFPDTIRRTQYVESKGLLYIGTGRLRRRRGRAQRPLHDAWRLSGCLAPRESDLSSRMRRKRPRESPAVNGWARMAPDIT